MSAAEILAELPNLTADERDAIACRIRELEDRDDVLFLQRAADLMFEEMDRAEEENGRRQTR